MLTVPEAKKMIAAEAARLNLKYGKISGKTQSFDGDTRACVTLKDVQPDPGYDLLTKFARQNKIILTTYVGGISG